MSSLKERLTSARPFVRSLGSLAAKIEQRSALILLALAGCVFVVAALKARYRRFWRIVTTGADNQPPFYHLLTARSLHLFGNDAWGLRLPSVAGYLLFCCCLFWFIGRRTSWLYGLLAFLFPSLTGCWYYATEGRPYALVLGCTGLAAVCWQAISMDFRRRLMLIGLFLALTGTLNLHYYSPLLFAPFAFAESVRTYLRRKIDWGVWIALVLPAISLVSYIGILRQSRVNSGIPFASYAIPTWFGSLAEFVNQFLAPALVAFLAIACLYAVWSVLSPPQSAPEIKVERSKAELSNFALLLGFTLLPILGIAFSKFGTHVFFTRYIIGSMFGICGLTIMVLWFAFTGAKGPALLTGVIFLGLFARSSYFEMQEAFAVRRSPADSASFYQLPMNKIQSDLPIVAGGVNEFMDIQYYGDNALRARTVYLSSEKYANQYLAFTFLERMMIGSAPYFGTDVIDYNRFTQEHSTFYLLGGTSWWLVPKLIDEGAQLQLLQGGTANPHGVLFDDFFLVHMPVGLNANATK